MMHSKAEIAVTSTVNDSNNHCSGFVPTFLTTFVICRHH